jgi:AbrB family looped-hinge helix DNA binding protein
MTYTATVTSKRQLTIPVEVFLKLGLKEGEKLLVRERAGVIELQSAKQLVNRLAGSLPIPKGLQGLSEEALIKRAKMEYFRRKFGSLQK